MPYRRSNHKTVSCLFVLYTPGRSAHAHARSHIRFARSPHVRSLVLHLRLEAGRDRFPLLLAPTGNKQTITLGVQQFLGQYITDWNAVLSALSAAIIPVLIFYVIFSKQLIRGLTSGAVK